MEKEMKEERVGARLGKPLRSNKKINPKCLHGRDLGYAITGHMTPCCWTNISWNDTWLSKFFTPEMHIDNFDTIEDILNSEVWVNFFEMLENDNTKAPLICKQMCSGAVEDDPEALDSRLIE